MADERKPYDAGALAGIRVLSFGGALAGGECPALLADLGAEVVKVESVARAKATRFALWRDHAPVYEPSGVQTSSSAGVIGRNQYNVSIDMSSEAGRALAIDMIGAADVLLENFSTGVMGRWGLTPERIAEEWPQLVYLSMPAYGWDGPYSKFAAFGGNMSSYVGLTDLWGVSQGTHNDYLAAAHGAFSVLAGLEYRERYGRGVCIEMTQTEVGAAMLGPFLLDASINKVERSTAADLSGEAVFQAVLPSLGFDAWTVIDVHNEPEWQRLCEIVDPALATDARFGNRDSIRAHYEEAKELIGAWTSTRTPHQVMTILQKAGIRAGAMQNGENLFHDPELWSRNYVVEIEHPDLGRYAYPSTALRMSKTPSKYYKRSSRVGEDNAEILGRWLGLSEDDVAKLDADRAF
jgi:crotonobetainyl-CoA:carnitine CoA-transferase CaiB-like acyl-CoA transferase